MKNSTLLVVFCLSALCGVILTAKDLKGRKLAEKTQVGDQDEHHMDCPEDQWSISGKNSDDPDWCRQTCIDNGLNNITVKKFEDGKNYCCCGEEQQQEVSTTSGISGCGHDDMVCPSNYTLSICGPGDADWCVGQCRINGFNNNLVEHFDDGSIYCCCGKEQPAEEQDGRSLSSDATTTSLPLMTTTNPQPTLAGTKVNAEGSIEGIAQDLGNHGGQDEHHTDCPQDQVSFSSENSDDPDWCRQQCINNGLNNITVKQFEDGKNYCCCGVEQPVEEQPVDELLSGIRRSSFAQRKKVGLCADDEVSSLMKCPPEGMGVCGHEDCDADCCLEDCRINGWVNNVAKQFSDGTFYCCCGNWTGKPIG